MHYNSNLHLPIITIIKNFKATEFPPSWQFQRVQAPQDLQMVIHMSSLYVPNPTIIAFQHQLYITSLLVEMLQHRYWWPQHISTQHICLLLHQMRLILPSTAFHSVSDSLSIRIYGDSIPIIQCDWYIDLGAITALLWHWHIGSCWSQQFWHYQPCRYHQVSQGSCLIVSLCVWLCDVQVLSCDGLVFWYISYHCIYFLLLFIQ
jgi:hypothetical protein